ncbi:MAG: dihydrolipoyl dehydrogenase [Thermoplasmata archaeon]|uniref:Dihydrolipoyl dehydrogenase n=1 Tax=Candidatus Sysuiplasma superficiale TaxID=2823368 RepID=A0A8J7YQH8_9ARCH|nr:dihydrolipoyl dehydrogenase [Candidatus Sysuiplasma superficiale]
MEKTDVITIGAGGGAYPGAFELSRANRKVVMVDIKGVTSGNCLSEGCIPSKTVRETAVMFSRSRRFASYGIDGKIFVDYSKIVEHKDAVQQARYAMHERELSSFPGLELVKGMAEIQDDHHVLVHTESGDKEYSADYIIIASGSESWRPSIEGIEHCIDSRDIFSLNPTLRQVPESLTVIGGGYIGLETASMFAALGSKVTLLEFMPRVLSNMDEDFVSGLVSLLDPSIEILTSASVTRVVDDGKAKRTSFTLNGKEREVESDVVLCATGRRPVIPEGADRIGIRRTKNGITVDASMRTNIDNIYATGDVNGLKPLFHAAVRMSLVAAHNILSGRKTSDYVDLLSIPTTVFTIPAGAVVGVTRKEASGIRLIEGHYRFEGDSRAQIFGETEGEIRLFFDAMTTKLVGGWVMGIDAGNLIGEIAAALSLGAKAIDLANMSNQHPMASEGISSAAREVV